MVAIMPWPASMYHVASLPGTSMPATFHSCFSVLCVPELSPRLTKGSSFGEGLQGGGDVFALDAGRVGGGSDQHEVVVHHLMAVHAEAVGHELFLKGGACTSSTSTSQSLPWARALPVPTGNPSQIDARVLFEDGLRYSRRPVSCVLVVVAIIKVSALAIWGSSRRERTRKALSRRIEKRSLQRLSLTADTNLNIIVPSMLRLAYKIKEGA